MTTHADYQLIPLTAEDAERLRSTGGEVYIADAPRYYPCRQCLRDAELGEELILVSFDPFEQDSPYRSSSPIFIHRYPCQKPELDGLPAQLTGRQLSVRAFDSDAMMVDAAIIDGNDLDAVLNDFFGSEVTDHVDVHNASRGCWAVRVSGVPSV